MERLKYIYWTTFLAFALIVAGCSTKVEVGECPEMLPEGSLGEPINTPYDEFSPMIVDDYLYFTFNAGESGLGNEILSVNLNTGKIESSRQFLYKGFELHGTPYFYIDYRNRPKALMSGRFEDEADFNIYQLSYENGVWGSPIVLGAEINTKANEVSPSISADGSTLYFSSDREGGIGNYDIYYSDFDNDIWNEAINIGDMINSESDELNAYDIGEGLFFYASDVDGDFDIYYNQFTSLLPTVSKRLEYPVNTSSNESSFYISNNKIYLSSDREPSCGYRDLYSFDFCEGIKVSGRVVDTDGKAVREGKVELIENNLVVDSYSLSFSDSYSFDLRPNKKYQVKYINTCLPGEMASSMIETYCSPIQPIKYVADIVIGKQTPVFTFEDYKLPFFSTGYYKPMTTLNLQELRQQLAYGIFKDNKQSSYINQPNEIYDKLAPQIDRAIQDANRYIYTSVERLENDCSDIEEMMVVEIRGYADPRPIPKGSRYVGPSIKDKDLGVHIENGAIIDNDVLSMLRAYYTALELRKNLSKHPRYNEIKNMVVWRVKGMGVDKNPSEDMLYQRHVQVDISIMPAEVN